jgi:hypothetical protein
MSVLPAGQTLRQFLPDVDDLMYNPTGYLGEEPLAIGPRRMYGLAGVFAAGGVAFLLAAGLAGNWRDERVLLGIGLLLGSMVWVSWSMRLRGHQIVLHPDGVEIKYFDSVVWCPWALFDADGPALVPEGDNPQVGLTLPVAATAVPYVELRRNDSVVAHGAKVRALQMRFTGPDEITLPARYELAAGELGELLQRLGQRLGRELPKGTPPPEAYLVNELIGAEANGPDGEGWCTVPVSRLHFPPRCVDCGRATKESMPFLTQANGGRGLRRLVGVGQPLVVKVPMCPVCQERLQDARDRAGMRGLWWGALLGPVTALGLMVGGQGGDFQVLVLSGLGGAACGSLLGFLVGNAIGTREPIEFRRYAPDVGTVEFRCREAQYAEEVLAGARAVKK